MAETEPNRSCVPLPAGAKAPAGNFFTPAQMRHAEFRERIDTLLNDFDYVILPCAPTERLTLGADHSQTRPRILRYTVPMSLAGVPVVTLPDTSGAGVQLCAARGQDARLLALAAQLGSQT
ncbi:MAG TPA: amidase family protein [Chthoniobacterales bacterium]|nr:amidase family protein [Chthoniobacterales bacterium]